MYNNKYSDEDNEDDNFEEEYIDDEYEQSSAPVNKDFWEVPAAQKKPTTVTNQTSNV